MSLTELDVKRAIRQLAMAYQKNLSDAEEADLVKLWQGVALKGIEPSELKEAVRERIRSDSAYFPKGGQIRQLALEIRMRHGGHHQEVKPALDGLTCPACHQKLRILKPHEQVLQRWDDETKQQVNILPESKHERYGILHDLSVPHKGLPVEYGRWRLVAKERTA